ncbi:hypothetical protein [Rubritalea tangerina]|uniref:hypothetical protein n=1 Tax=Rubritalea tangerina TaxID=430798 RepID=UPI0036121EE8
MGAKLPESLKKRVLDLDLYPRFEMRIEQGLTAAETEHLVINVLAHEKKERRTEKLVKEGWELVEQKPVKGSNSYDLLVKTSIRFQAFFRRWGSPTTRSSRSLRHESRSNSLRSLLSGHRIYRRPWMWKWTSSLRPCLRTQ